MFKKILIANRGEIACNIIQVCKKMNINTVAVFSESDKDSLHIDLADEKYCIGPSDAKKSYSNMCNILSIALASGAEAIHPGYGFLSENYEFAKMCEENGVVFIGPPSSVIKKMSDKMSAKRFMKTVGLSVIEGYEVNADFPLLKKTAAEIGYPVIIKSKNGGGGRGIKIVRQEEELLPAAESALQESKQYFNADMLYMEKYLENASHIELQIVADNHENVVSLGTRDCSIQIANQKIVEEAPDNKVSPNIINEISNVCKQAVKQLRYENCGTFEFLVDTNENFYFMEMNCRLQVERCVTEAISNIDLIATQIKIAAGEPLPWEQNDVVFEGHSIEVRINLQNPSLSGITKLLVPKTEHAIFKTALKVGGQVPPFYDSMIGKLIVHGKDRADAVNKMTMALEAIVIDGVETNIECHKKILKDPVFINGTYNTQFMNNFNRNVSSEKLQVYDKLNELIDQGTFKEIDQDLESENILDFVGYNEKLLRTKESTGTKEAVVCGEGKIGSSACVIIVMDKNFMMGSMGVVVGEKITRAFEYATKQKLPVVAVTASGGARMQEGIFSLMQMAKTSGAVLKHSQKKLLYISIITNPTLGGVSASFASLADIIIGEQSAIFGFSGKRIVEEVTRTPLPDDFQSVDYNLKHGMVDLVLDYKSIKPTVERLLKIHN